MKIKLLLLAAVTFNCASFAWPVIESQDLDLVSLLDGLTVHEPNLALLPQLPVNQPNLARRCLSFFKKDVFHIVPFSSIGTATAFLYLAKDTEMASFDRITGALTAFMVPQLTAGTICMFGGEGFFLD